MNEPTPAEQDAYGCGAGRDCGCISPDAAAEAERRLAEAAARAREALDNGEQPAD